MLAKLLQEYRTRSSWETEFVSNTTLARDYGVGSLLLKSLE